jgi:ABC-2 type transport system permease protein
MRAAGADLRDALHAEWTKLRTLASTYWLLLAAAALTIGVGAAAAATFSCQAGACVPAVTGADPAKISLSGIDVGQAVIAVLAVMAIGGEYSTGMIRLTLAAMPRRLTVLSAKAAVITGCVLAASAVAVLGSFLAGRLILPGRGLTAANGYQLLSLADGPDLRAAVGGAAYLALIALLAVGIATAVRDSAVAIGIVLALLYLFPIVSSVIPNPDLARHLEQIAPMTAGQYIMATTGINSLPLTPWQGLGVLVLWAVGALLLGAAVLRLRDA